LRNCQSSVVEAASDEVWPVLEATELTPGEAVQVGDVGVGSKYV